MLPVTEGAVTILENTNCYLHITLENGFLDVLMTDDSVKEITLSQPLDNVKETIAHKTERWNFAKEHIGSAIFGQMKPK